MTDKEVGELWQGCGNFSKAEVQRLIRKLVEERVWFNTNLDEHADRSFPQHLNDALKAFGIDPSNF